MATFIYRCPTTALNVQGWLADEPPDPEGSTYRGITCLMCQQIHLVDPATGKLLSDQDD